MSAVNKVLEPLPSNTKVLVSIDELENRDLLNSIDKLGWYRINYRSSGTASQLSRTFRKASLWAHSAVEQAILSLGSAFVGTEGSNLGPVTELRVQTYQKGQTVYV